MKSSFSLFRPLFCLLAFVLMPLLARAQLTGTVGSTFSYQVVTSPPAASGALYSALSLPPGLAINSSTGLVSGTPTTAGTYNAVISVTSGGITNNLSVTFTIGGASATPVINSAPPSGSANIGTAFTYALTATNSPTSFNIGTLPPGLSIGGTTTAPTITGTPTVASTYNVNVSANNAAGTGTVSALTFTFVGGPTISGTTTGTMTVGSAGSLQLSASPTATSYSLSVQSGQTGLPPGVSLDSATGLISGTPTVAGSYTFTVRGSTATLTGAAATVTINVGNVSVVTGSPTIALSGTVGQAFSYAFTASNSPTSFNIAGGYPAGLSAGGTAGAPTITGTPTAGGTTVLTVSANNALGKGPDATLTITIASGTVPTITSPAVATATVGSAFLYQIIATQSPTSYSASNLPSGLSINTSTGLISGVPQVTGSFSVLLGAANTFGTGTATLSLTVAPSSGGGGSGGGGGGGGSGGGGGGGGGGVLTPPPIIATQPVSQSVAVGDSVTFTVAATGSGLSYQWQKNGTEIFGATNNSYTISSVRSTDAGSYVVLVANAGGFVLSSPATLTVNSTVAPTIATQPASQSVAFGATVSLTVAANGTAPLAYQWRKDGVAIAGATAATLTLANVTTANAGSYSVVVSNSAGSVTSGNAIVTVAARAIAGTYFGTFGANEGNFALLVRGDRTGVFLGYATIQLPDGSKLTARVALISRNVVIGTDGSFSVTPASTPNVAALGSAPAVAAAEVEYHINGSISPDGVVTGSVPELNLAFSAPAAGTGATAPFAGFYQSGAVGKSSSSYAIVGAAGEAFIMTVTGTTVDAGKGTVSTDGSLNIVTANNAVVTGSVQGDSATLSATVTPPTGAAVTFVGANDDRTDTEKLINISTRSRTGTTADTLIAGFVITGDQRKTVLVRAIGPTLGSAFNVGGVLSAPRLEIFRGSTSLAVGTDWGAASNATQIAAAAARLGAFALANNSRDAAVLLDLDPGAYTAVVTGQGGASGVSLVEVYDATNGPIPRGQRIINIATRATAGTGDNALIAGFVISGTVPKRVLVRGVGPALAPFGVAGVLARPQLSVMSGATVLAQNAGWGTSPDAAAIAAGSAQVGAFALTATSQDAALIIYLAPGAYTAQISGVGNTTGVALIEVYELP